MTRRKKRNSPVLHDSGYACTVDAPYAFKNGASCCKVDIDYPDGNPISLTSTACPSSITYGECATYGCTNYLGKKLSYQANVIYMNIYIYYNV